MATRPRLSSNYGIYHVVYRGINKQRIFEEAADYEKYLSILRKYESICGFKLIAYCLMSNHIHLLIKPGEVPLPRIFQRVTPSFVYWYNRKYHRVGSLFQSRFKSRPINSRSQLLIVSRYIHQNPVKAAICDHPGQYKYSSFPDYFDNDLVDGEIVLSEISKEEFLRFNCEENDDYCLDIEEELPRLDDEYATKIMRRLSGCSSVAEFQTLSAERRDEVLLNMRTERISMKQASRITGVSYGVIRKVNERAAQLAGSAVRPADCMTSPGSLDFSNAGSAARPAGCMASPGSLDSSGGNLTHSSSSSSSIS